MCCLHEGRLREQAYRTNLGLGTQVKRAKMDFASRYIIKWDFTHFYICHCLPYPLSLPVTSLQNQLSLTFIYKLQNECRSSQQASANELG